MSTTATERTVRLRAEALALLPNVESFQILTEECERQRQRMERTLIARVMAEGMSGDAIQRQADYNRGYVDGMRYAVIKAPEAAIRMLQRDEIREVDEEVEDRWA